MTDELKPCPFCGAHPELQQIGNQYTKRKRGFQVVCMTWGCQAKHVSLTLAHPMEKAREWAIAAWNRRADHSPDAGKMALPAIAEPLGTAPEGDALDRAIAQTAAECDAELTHMAKRAVVVEPTGDLVKAIGNTIEKAWDECQDLPPIEFCDHEKDYIARAILALFQPQMEAAEGLLRAVDAVKKRGLYEHELIPALWAAADKARAAGLGRESHD